MKDYRNEIIRMVLDMQDTIDTLEFDNAILRKRVDVFESATPDEAEKMSFLDMKLLEYGQEKLLDSVLGYWRNVNYSVDANTGEVSIQQYEDWRSNVVKKAHIPSWCSVDGFYDYFDVHLHAIYEREREKAIADAKEEK